MDSSGDRLRAARKAAGYDAARRAAHRHGWPESTYASHENGQTPVPVEAAQEYAKAFGTSAAWILTGEGPRRQKTRARAPLGYVGAGAEIIPVDQLEDAERVDEIYIPPGIPDAATPVIVRGQSMYPRYFDGEYLFYVRDSRAPNELTGLECVMQLADGRIFVKVLRRGSKPGLFNLESWNAPLMEDQKVEWAAPVISRVNKAAY